MRNNATDSGIPVTGVFGRRGGGVWIGLFPLVHRVQRESLMAQQNIEGHQMKRDVLNRKQPVPLVRTFLWFVDVGHPCGVKNNRFLRSVSYYVVHGLLFLTCVTAVCSVKQAETYVT